MPGDGAKGLREAVLVAFPKAQYILDHPHLKSHLYDTASAWEREGPERHAWVLASGPGPLGGGKKVNNEGGDLMRFYTHQHPFYCGIDLHARSM